MIKYFVLSLVGAIMMVFGAFGIVGSWVIWDDNDKFDQYGEMLYKIGAGPGALFFASILCSLFGWWIANVAKN